LSRASFGVGAAGERDKEVFQGKDRLAGHLSLGEWAGPGGGLFSKIESLLNQYRSTAGTESEA
jgi:hypothetical protein